MNEKEDEKKTEVKERHDRRKGKRERKGIKRDMPEGPERNEKCKPPRKWER